MAKKENNKKKHFFKDFKAELKKVIWPTPKQIVNNTVAVLVIVLITAAIVFVLDLCFDFINSKGINAIKGKIRNKVVVQNVVVEENAENTEESTTEEANPNDEEEAPEEDTTEQEETTTSAE